MLESPREIQKSDEVSRGYEEPVLHAAPPSEEEWRDDEEKEKEKEKERNYEQQKCDEATPPRADKVEPVHTVRGKFQSRGTPQSLIRSLTRSAQKSLQNARQARRRASP